jgi:hypothetical protein
VQNENLDRTIRTAMAVRGYHSVASMCRAAGLSRTEFYRATAHGRLPAGVAKKLSAVLGVSASVLLGMRDADV